MKKKLLFAIFITLMFILIGGMETYAKQANPITVTERQTVCFVGSTSQTKNFTGASNAQGNVTYSIVSQKNIFKNGGGNTVNYFTVNSSAASLTQKSGTAEDFYIVVVRATAAGNSTYESGYKDITLYVCVQTTVASGVAGYLTSPQILSIDYSTNSQVVNFKGLVSNVRQIWFLYFRKSERFKF